MSSLNQKLVLSVDVVLLALMDTGLHFGMVERMHGPSEGEWTLPGGTVDTKKDETSKDSARRILADRAGIDGAHIEQLATFDGRKRDSRGWSASIAYLALVSSQAGLAVDSIRWRPVETPGKLPFDHNGMLASGVQRLRDKVAYSSMLVHLMPKRFTLPELHAAYERVRTTPSEIGRFRRVLLKSGFLEEVVGQMRGEFRKGQVYRPRKGLGIEMLETPLE